MEHRTALAPGEVLEFPGMPCTVEEEIGRGSNAIVYKCSYPDLLNRQQRHTVLMKELFPLHPKGAVYRDNRGDIVCEPEGEALFALHRRSFTYGNRVHLRMLEKRPELTGGNLNTFSLRGTMYTVLGYTGGRTLESAGETANLRLLVLRLLGLLDSLEAFHESGFLHLDIAPDNILLTGQGSGERVTLIDYNSVYEWDMRTGPAYYSVKPGYSAPEILTGGVPGPASDLYSVTAVFFRCLTGAALTPFQVSRRTPPDVSDCEALRDQPDTVRVMVRQILRRGLQNLPQRRWPSAGEMRRDVRELLDRIDGVGITHWALWEGGRRMVDRAIRENPSLAFLRRPEELFPSNVRLEDGGVIPADAWTERLSERPGQAAQLLAPGGIGKTTALLRGVMERSRDYAPSRPAVLYLSLYGWKAGDPAYIHNRILENLRFKPEQKSFADARYALDQLMRTPLQTPRGERPVLVLLLDGLNEADGATQPLLEEIAGLSRLPGVSLLVSSRSGESALPFPAVSLEPLRDEDVAEGLARHGLLPPESEELRRLLRTPLLLSVFLQSAQAEGRQLLADTKEELLDAYFRSLLTKELRELPDAAGRRWKLDAALTWVLPAIAAELERKRRALSDAELLPTVERCYRLFSARLLRRAFPRWIGHSGAIRGGAANGEEWYGQMVHELLWKRLGLLVRDERGNYQIFHQLIREYLCALDAENQRRIWRQRRKRLYLVSVLCLVVLACGGLAFDRLFRPQPYLEEYADPVLVYGAKGYVHAGQQYEELRELLNCAITEPQAYPAQLERYQAQADRGQKDADCTEAYAAEMLEHMLPTGKVMPWSGKKLETAYYEELTGLAGERWEEYGQYAGVLTWVMEDPMGRRLYREKYLSLLSSLIEADAAVTARLYQIVCLPHVTGKYAEDADTPDARNYRGIVSSVPYQGIHMDFRITDPAMLKSDLSSLQAGRNAVLEELRLSGILSAYGQHLADHPEA